MKLKNIIKVSAFNLFISCCIITIRLSCMSGDINSTPKDVNLTSAEIQILKKISQEKNNSNDKLDEKEFLVLEKQKELITSALSNLSVKKLIFQDNFAHGIFDLNKEDVLIDDSFFEILRSRLSENKSLIVARVVTADSCGVQIVNFYEAYVFIYHIFKDNFLNFLRNKYTLSKLKQDDKEIPDENIRDINRAIIVEPIKFYYLDDADKPNFEFIGQIDCEIDKIKLPSKNFKILLLANMPNEMCDTFKISKIQIFKQQINLARLYNSGCAQIRLDIDKNRAVKILSSVIFSVLKNLNLILNCDDYDKNSQEDLSCLISLKFRAFFNLSKIYSTDFETFKNFIEMAERMLDNLSEKSDIEVELAVRFDFAKILLLDPIDKICLKKSREQLELIIDKTNDEKLRKKALDFFDHNFIK